MNAKIMNTQWNWIKENELKSTAMDSDGFKHLKLCARGRYYHVVHMVQKDRLPQGGIIYMAILYKSELQIITWYYYLRESNNHSIDAIAIFIMQLLINYIS